MIIIVQVSLKSDQHSSGSGDSWEMWGCRSQMDASPSPKLGGTDDLKTVTIVDQFLRPWLLNMITDGLYEIIGLKKNKKAFLEL